ncbi:MAG: methyltransferase domain-containing protein [Acidiferrobacterales bacterium]|nr:methyltransferase domain-containing protein [Acidiferrobacterales bacterium]
MFKSNSKRESARREVNKVIAYWDEAYPGKYDGYVSPYRDDVTFDNLFSFYNSFTKFVAANSNTLGLDLGCWLGVPCILESVSSGGRVFGVEIQESFTKVARDWQQQTGVSNIYFDHIDSGCIPLESKSMDWVLINQVLCNALQHSFENTISEAARVLKDGGTLVVADSNNPYCSSVRNRLSETFKTVEIGTGSQEAPTGSFFRARFAIVKQTFPDIPEEHAALIARETCYLWKPEIVEATEEFINSKKSPKSFFEIDLPRSPVNPSNGAAIGNYTNPYYLAKLIERNGLVPIINTSLSYSNIDPVALRNSLEESGSFYIIAKRK